MDVKLQFLDEHLENFYILVVHRFVQQVVEAEATRNHQHHALVKSRSYVKRNLIVILELKGIVFEVEYHSALLVVEVFPDLEDLLQVLSGYFVEMALQGAQLLLVLLLEYLKVKAQKSLNLGSVFCPQTVNIIIQVFKSV